MLQFYEIGTQFMESFPFVPPTQYVMPPPPFTEHVSIHGKSLCKNFARASGVQIMCDH